MKGTLTFHLPLRRGPATPPEATLVIRRITENQWSAGLSVCSRSDQFVKKWGRARAASNLQHKPFTADTPLALAHLIDTHFGNLNSHRPATISPYTITDVYALIQTLNGMRIE